MSKKIKWNEYYKEIMEKHKEQLILYKKKERHDLKKRIEHIEQELDGMGVKDFEFKIIKED